MKTTFYNLLSILIFFSISNSVSAQTFEIKGKVTELKTGESMIGVHIVVSGDMYGTVSGYDGSFVLKTLKSPPFKLHFSFVGFESQEIEVRQENEFVDIRLLTSEEARRNSARKAKWNKTERSALQPETKRSLWKQKLWKPSLTFNLSSKKGHVLNILPPDLVVQLFLIEPQGFFVGQQLQHSEGEITF